MRTASDRLLTTRCATISTMLLIGILAAVILSTFASLPMSWDEPDHQGYGRRILGWTMGLISGEPDDSALTKGNLYLYGGAFDAPVEAIIHFLPFDHYTLRHLFTAVVGLLGVIGCAVLGRQAGGPWVGLIAATLLTLTPSWYGHMFWNPKDIPFATGVVWTLVLLARAAPRFSDLKTGESALLGAVLGLTLGVRVGGVILFPLFAGVAVVAWLRAEKASTALAASARTLAIIGIVAWVIMLAAWPYAQVAPLRHPLEALRAASNFDWGLTVLFRGKEVPSDALPLSYLPTMLLIKLPEAVLILLAAALAAAARLLYRRRLPTLARTEGAATLLAAATVALPLLAVIVMRPVLYDGIRHVLFILPPLMVMAALGAGAAWRSLGRAPALTRPLILSLVAFWMAFQIITYVRLHPYQYIDYNLVVGGLRGAAGRFETDYWGTSYREAVRHLDLSLTADERARNEPWEVWTCSDPLLSSYYFPSHLTLAATPEKADFFLATTRWGCPDTVPGQIVGEVKRLGVTLALIKDLRQ